MFVEQRIGDTLRIAKRAIEVGAPCKRPHAYRMDVDYSGNCSSSVPIAITGRDRPFPGREGRIVHYAWDNYHQARRLKYRRKRRASTARAFFLNLEVRCRRCDNCMRARARRFRERALSEIVASRRSWYGTLTFRSSERYKIQCAAYRQSPNFDQLDEKARFACLHRAASHEVTKWLKRVREQSKAQIRYLLVSEAHKDGFPHFHFLMHEGVDSTPLLYKHVAKQWKAGFSKVNLVVSSTSTVDDKGRCAWYVTKYLTKYAAARVRCSVRYGKYALKPEEGSPSVVEKALEKDNQTKTNNGFNPQRMGDKGADNMDSNGTISDGLSSNCTVWIDGLSGTTLPKRRAPGLSNERAPPNKPSE